MEDREYDVVITGSGVAGAIIAKTLVDAGKSVLVLEAGLDEGVALGGDAAYRTHQGYLETFYKALAKAPNSPYPAIANAPSTDGEYMVNKTKQPFASDALRAGGGTTQHWLGTTLRMLPNDFKTNTLYGQGVDWPFDYAHLRPYYEMAEHEIGVSGDVNDVDFPRMGEGYFGPGYVFPMLKIPQSYLDKEMMKKIQGLKVILGEEEHEIICCVTPQGRNSIPNPLYTKKIVQWSSDAKKLSFAPEPDSTIYPYPEHSAEVYEPIGALWDPYTGQRCEGNSSCVPICPVQAKYNALKTLKKADQKVRSNAEKGILGGTFEIRSRSVVYDLIINKDTKRIEGVRYKKYATADSTDYSTHLAKGRIYVLAANAIENAKILLAANAANSSDQVGRNLMDHMCLLTWGTFPTSVFPFRGPGSTTNISTFRDGGFRKDHAPWICPLDNWGWGWPKFSPGTDVTNAVERGVFGEELRKELHDTLTRQILLHFECEQNPDPENRVTIDPKYKDQLDNYRPVIHYGPSEYMLKAFEAAFQVSEQIFKTNEIKDRTFYDPNEPNHVHYNGKGYTYRGAGHIVGTHRMGKDKSTSVVDPNLRTWDHDNLYLAGAGNMPTLGTSNPTLTLAALSFKASEAILAQLETAGAA